MSMLPVTPYAAQTPTLPAASVGSAAAGPPVVQTVAGDTVVGSNGTTLSIDPKTLSYTGSTPRNASGASETIVGRGDFSWSFQSNNTLVNVSPQGDVQISVNGSPSKSIGNMSNAGTLQYLAQYVDPTTLQDISTITQTHDVSKASFEQRDMPVAGVQELSNIQLQVSAGIANKLTAQQAGVPSYANLSNAAATAQSAPMPALPTAAAPSYSTAALGTPSYTANPNIAAYG